MSRRPKNIGPSVEATADRLLTDMEAGVSMSCVCIPMAGEPRLDVWLIASKDKALLQQLRQQLGEQLQSFFEGNAGELGEVATVKDDQVLVNLGDGFKPVQ